jgi:hypothetical protein
MFIGMAINLVSRYYNALAGGGGAGDRLLIEDGVDLLLMEDGTSFILLETD